MIMMICHAVLQRCSGIHLIPSGARSDELAATRQRFTAGAGAAAAATAVLLPAAHHLCCHNPFTACTIPPYLLCQLFVKPLTLVARRAPMTVARSNAQPHAQALCLCIRQTWLVALGWTFLRRNAFSGWCAESRMGNGARVAARASTLPAGNILLCILLGLPHAGATIILF